MVLGSNFTCAVFFLLLAIVNMLWSVIFFLGKTYYIHTDFVYIKLVGYNLKVS